MGRLCRRSPKASRRARSGHSDTRHPTPRRSLIMHLLITPNRHLVRSGRRPPRSAQSEPPLDLPCQARSPVAHVCTPAAQTPSSLGVGVPGNPGHRRGLEGRHQKSVGAIRVLTLPAGCHPQPVWVGEEEQQGLSAEKEVSLQGTPSPRPWLDCQ